ncbi:MAG: carboxypeptidase regulatory-like domain-containing protein [Anaerolineales bacterium]|nr:carboxypeptidase regulatory-like domain-containing protein [Anaerolineales bacterium]
MKTKFNFRKWLRSRNGLISMISALLVLIVVAVIFGGGLSGLTGTAGVPAELPPGANCLPTCDVTDGRMFTIASDGLVTLAGQSIFIKIAVPESVASFDIGIFDGDTSGIWDLNSGPLTYTLYADPTAAQVGTEQVVQWLGDSMADNDWTNFTIDQDPRAQAPSGDYFYYLRVDLPNAATATKIFSSFKVRSTSPIELATNQSFGYMAPLSSTNQGIIYPSYPDLTQTTFDGTWDMYLNVPVSQSSFVIWDGDFDYGSYDCSVNDTDDPDTPNDTHPAWAAPNSDVLEGVAVSTNPCKDSAGAKITAANGQTTTTGQPSDDNVYAAYRRDAPVTYDVIDPNGNVYHNANPSGNTEWEQFLISSDHSVAADHYTDALLPAGTYHVRITGLDLSNLNAWHLIYDAVCVYEDGTPCVPVLRPYKIGDTVWADTNGNGVQDAGEAGIAGVTVTLLDSFGNPVPNGTATTDASGNYFFKVEAGAYTVQVDAANFEAEGVLTGYAPTTSGGNSQTNTVTTDNVLTYDFGYNVAPASLGDFVWNDLNGNGIQEDGEGGLAGVTVNLLGSDGTTVAATTTTDAAGSYSFTELLPGTYYVQVVAPAGQVFTTADAGSDDAKDSDVDATGKTAAISLSAGETNTSVDAGLLDALACPANLVLNPSFEENKGSPPKSWKYGTAGPVGVPVVDGLNAGYISGSGTMYQAVNVTTGNSYTLTFYSGSHKPSKQTVKLQYFNKRGKGIGTAATHIITSDLEDSGFGGPYTLMLDPAPSDATSLRIMVSANRFDYAKVDMLCLQPTTPPATASIGDLVWKDTNNNGVQDDGEPGMADVTVNLLGSDGKTVAASTTTDAAGNYSFTELLPGTYYVQVVAPAETSFTKANAGGDDARDSDIDPASGKTAAISLKVGEANNTVDAGLKESLSLSCPANLVLNPSFEENTGSPPRSWTNGTAGPVGVPVVDGKNAGYITGSKTMYQSVDVTAGSSYTLTFYSGSHVPSIQTVKMQYFAGDSAIGEPATHTITDDLEIVGFGGPYSLTLGPAPSDATSLRIMVSANNKDYGKVDSLCLEATEPVEPPPPPPMCTTGNTYKVETTNNPFYSVKFNFASGTEVKDGGYDIFKYTLPADVVAAMTSMQVEVKAATDSRTYNLTCDFTSPEGCGSPVGDDAYAVSFDGAVDNGDGTYTLKFKVYVYGEHGLSHVSFSLPEGQTAGGLTGSYTTEGCE